MSKIHARAQAFRANRAQKGFTLVEISVVIVLASLLLFGVFYMLNRATERSQTKEEIEHLNTMMADARTKFRQQGNYQNVSPAVLIDLGIVPPAKLTSSPGNITTAWNTQVAVAEDALVNAGDAISFTYQVPRRACSDFVDGGAGSASRVTVGGVAVKDALNGAAELDTITLAAQCDSDNAAGGEVAVIFTQGR